MKKLLLAIFAFCICVSSASAYTYIKEKEHIFYNPENSSWATNQQTNNDIQLKNKSFIGSGGFVEYYYKDKKLAIGPETNIGFIHDGEFIGINSQELKFYKYVYENMMKNGHCLGGEQSGHIIFSKHAVTGDGILTSLMVMEAVTEKKMSLGTLADEVKIYPQLLKNVRVLDKKTARENPAVIKAVDEVAQALGEEGRILVRESGTEPLIRVMVEAADDSLCEKYVDQVVKVIYEQGLAAE